MKTATCKKLFALLLGLMMCLGASSALAEEIVVPTLRAVPSDADMLPGNDELYEGYLYREVCDPAHGGMSFFSRLARAQLGDPEGYVYDALKPLIEKVAAGEVVSTQFDIPVSDMPEGYQSSFTFEELGITQLASGGSLTQEASKALFKAVFGDIGLVQDALLHDCPYDLYWYDITYDNATQTGGLSYTFSIANYSASHVEIGELSLRFYVADDYATGDFTTNPIKTQLANTANTNAQAVAHKVTASMTDEEILTLFKEEICKLVSYNDEAADDSYTGDYGDPWQLVHVFDGDDSTKVVCEGYSKAFQHLCDMTDFDNAVCYTVSGYMNGGGHMWNIVSLNGVNYLVDVTNSDTGMAGSGGGLFIALPASGDWQTAYTFVTASNQRITYQYDQDTTDLWDEEVLKLGAAPAKQYTVSFKANGGEGAMAAQTFTQGAAQTLTPNAFARAGYTFSGWNTAADGSGTAYADKQSVTLTDDLVLFAQWAPRTDIGYQVEYYEMDTDGKYPAEATRTMPGTGTTDTKVTADTNPSEGFSFDSENPANVTEGTITADGSLKLKVYLSRNKYLLTFDANGGEGGTSTEVYYGASITAPTVTKAGYTFGGWNASVPATMPARPLTFVAGWTVRDDIPFAIEYYEMGTDGQYPAEASWTVPGTGTTGAEATADTNPSEGFSFDSENPANVTEGTVAADGSLVLKVYMSRNKYLLTFDANGGEGGTTAEMYYDAAITAPTVTRLGYNYNGWNAPVPTRMPSQALTFVAQWLPASNVGYTVEYYEMGVDGQYPAEATRTVSGTGTTGAEVTADTNPSEGFTFDSENPANVTEGTVAADGSLVLKVYMSRNKYLLTFDANGGVGGTTAEVYYDAAITAPTVTKEGYTFGGWDKTVPSTMPAEALSFKAQWTADTDIAYTTEYYEMGIDGKYPAEATRTEPGTGTTGAKATADTNPSEGFSFDSENPANVTEGTITADGSLKLKVYLSRNKYLLTFDANGGVGGTSTEVYYGANITAPTVTKEGYTFGGWDKTVPSAMPAEALSFKAQWAAITYAVTVTDGSGSGEFAEGAAVTIIADTPAEGKRFAGWTGLEGLTLTSGSAATESVTFTMPAKAVNVTATYENIPVPTYAVTVTDGTGGGEFAEGAAVTITADTPAEGKRFAGWTGLEGLTLTNGSAATESVTFTMPAKAVNVTAAYEDIPVVTYAVTVPNGSGGGEFAEGAAVTITADTPAEGKRFAGWTGLEGLTITNGSAATETVTFIMPAKAVNVTATYEDIPAPQLPVITSPTAPQTVTVPLGQKGGMGVEAENADSFQWYVDRNDGEGYVAIRGATDAEYTTSEVTKLNDGYTYYCQVTNAAGFVNSPVFTLKVQEPIVIPPTGDSAPVGLWLLMLSAAAVMMFTLLKRKPCDN